MGDVNPPFSSKCLGTATRVQLMEKGKYEVSPEMGFGGS
jgi:hypothetical protein